MREILFRGKRKDDKQWVFGDLEHNGNRVPKWVDGQVIDQSTIGQFTGLTDKNGKKIFEGDIVKWDELEWGCPHCEIAEWNYSLFDARKHDWKEWCEVIGNIHDNPELLERRGD